MWWVMLHEGTGRMRMCLVGKREGGIGRDMSMPNAESAEGMEGPKCPDKDTEKRQGWRVADPGQEAQGLQTKEFKFLPIWAGEL